MENQYAFHSGNSNFHHHMYACCPQQHGHQVRSRYSPPIDCESASHVFSVNSMQPPRLQQTSCCSRIFVAFACVCLVSAVSIAWAAAVSLPLFLKADAAKARRPVPAVLRRFSVVKRVHSGYGSDEATLRQAFPHWRTPDGALDIESVVSDVASAISALVSAVEAPSADTNANAAN